jgi:hypothetical protein
MPSYEVVTVARDGVQRVHSYSTEDGLAPGGVLRIAGRDWLVERVEAPEPGSDSQPERVIAWPARYRVRLVHPDGREEVGASRRFRPDRPTIGHAFTTVVQGRPIAWQIMDEQLAYDAQGQPFLDLRAERDYSEYESLPDHELEHSLARGAEGAVREEMATAISRAQAAGLAMELVALDAGEDPDWPEAERFLDALILEEIETDLLEMCGVRIARDPRDSWLATAKARLASDLALFRADVEGDRDRIEEWEFRDGRIFASTGSTDDESDPDSGHGWMCRLVDSGVLEAAGFKRVRKADL